MRLTLPSPALGWSTQPPDPPSVASTTHSHNLDSLGGRHQPIQRTEQARPSKPEQSATNPSSSARTHLSRVGRRSSHFFRPVIMATVTTQASLAVFQPCKTRFLTGSCSKLPREFSAFRGIAAPSLSSSRSLKIEAKKGEWLPGLASPGYLTGSLPGDNGFDPLGLAEDPENLKWFVQAELVNGRWAMLGVAGMLLPEVLTKAGLINVPEWYDAGKSEYFASSSTLFVIEFILFHYVEIRRWQDIKNPGSVNQDPIFKQYSLPPNECGYPGGIFNPLNFAPTLEAKEKELANGRLAMLAFLGFVVQHNLTQKGPFENLVQHLSDPWHNTIIQTLRG